MQIGNEELARRVKDGDRDAAALLWGQNKGLLHIFFQRLYTRYREWCAACGVTFEDLEQLGYFAVLAAAQGFDSQGGANFATYLNFHAKREFYVAINQTSDRAKREPLNRALSLDKPVDLEDAEGDTLGDLQPDPAAAAELDAAIHEVYLAQLRRELDAALAKLPERERAVITSRYYDSKTLHAIGESLGVTGSRARQLEYQGMRALRRDVRLLRFHGEDLEARAYRGTSFTDWAYKGSAPERLTEQRERERDRARRNGHL